LVTGCVTYYGVEGQDRNKINRIRRIG